MCASFSAIAALLAAMRVARAFSGLVVISRSSPRLVMRRHCRCQPSSPMRGRI